MLLVVLVSLLIVKFTKFCFSLSELINRKLIQSSTLFRNFRFYMATLWNRKKLVVVAREIQQGSSRNSQSRNSTVPIKNEWHITQVSVEIEGRVTKKLSQDLSRTESRFLGGLSKLDKFLLNLQVRVHSGTVLGTSRNMNVENQEPIEDRSQNDPHSDVEASI